LESASHDTLGLQPLAITLSLPRALFLWALTAEGIAVVAFACQLSDVWGLALLDFCSTFVCDYLLVIGFFQSGLGSKVFGLPFPGFPAAREFFRRKDEETDPESA